jgi:hypothetical protein
VHSLGSTAYHKTVPKEVFILPLPFYKADGESFYHEFITFKCIQEDRQLNGIIQLLLRRTSSRRPLQQGKTGPVFCDAEDVILVDMLCGQMINSDLYIQTLKTWQKHFRRF